MCNIFDLWIPIWMGDCFKMCTLLSSKIILAPCFRCSPAVYYKSMYDLRTESNSINTPYNTSSFTKHSFDLRWLKVYSSQPLFLQAESNMISWYSLAMLFSQLAQLDWAGVYLNIRKNMFYVIPANFFSVKCVRFFVSTEPEFPKVYWRLPKFSKDSWRPPKISDNFRR